MNEKNKVMYNEVRPGVYTFGLFGFQREIARLGAFASTIANRPILTGVHVKLDKGLLVMESTDSYKLARYVIHTDIPEEVSFDGIFEYEFFVEQGKRYHKAMGVSIHLDTKNNIFGIGGLGRKKCRWTGVNYEGNYPAVDKLIGEEGHVIEGKAIYDCLGVAYKNYYDKFFTITPPHHEHEYVIHFSNEMMPHIESIIKYHDMENFKLIYKGEIRPIQFVTTTDHDYDVDMTILFLPIRVGW